MTGKGRLVLRWLLQLCGLALLFAAPAAAAPVELVERGCRIAAAPAVTLAEMLARPANAPCPEAPAPNAKGTIWIDYGAPAFLTDQSIPWRLLIDDHRVRSIDLYLVRADGTVERQSYDTAAPDRAWAMGGYFSLSIMPADAPVTRVLLRFNDVANMSLVRSIKVKSWREAIADERLSASLFGIAAGILGVTILFHLSLFFAIRRRFQLIYVANVAVLFVYAVSYSGLLLLAAPISGSILARLVSASLAAASATAIAFALDFLERRVLPKWLRHWAKIAVGVASAAAVALLIVPTAWTTPAYIASNIAGAHAILLMGLIFAVALAKGSHTARIFALGWLPPLAVAALYPLRTTGLFGQFAIPDGALLFALTLECMILSLPVAERIKRLRIEHERARERQHVLERQAKTDALTGLANRRGFDTAIRRAFAGANPQAAALLIIDIDHFKSVNDRYGHGHGDLILRRVADHVAKTAGAGAIVARLGGEEFVVALRGHDERRAATIAERIRIGMEDACDETGADPVTVSIGVACGAGDAIDLLISEADRALYDAKRQGRDCVVVAGQSAGRAAEAA